MQNKTRAVTIIAFLLLGVGVLAGACSRVRSGPSQPATPYLPGPNPGLVETRSARHTIAVGRTQRAAEATLQTASQSEPERSIVEAPANEPTATPAPATMPAGDVLLTAIPPVLGVIHQATDAPGAAAVLGLEHPGYKAQRCELCHDLPIHEHTTSSTWECAACHGGNGACDPGVVSLRQHLSTDNCVECHQSRHGFEQAAMCVSCHYAEIGTAACDGFALLPDDSSLLPAAALSSSCINWPDEEISKENSARLMTGLSKGQAAVDFSLMDVDGTVYTLTGMLEEKPVLLVLGGFT